MATLKQRLHRKNSGGTYDTIHLETSADLVLMTDGSTKLSDKISSMDTAISGKAAASHTHTTISGNAGTATKLATARTIRTNLASTATASFDGSGNVTPGVTGILPVANGGTGVTSLANLKKAMGISESQGSGSSFDIANAGIGNFVKWANKMWIIVHVESDRIYLAATFIQTTTTFGSSTVYNGSNLAAAAKAYENTIPSDSLALAVNTTVNGVTAKIFAPSYEQMNGGFMYFFSNSQRELNNTIYWTSSPYSSGYVYCVTADGSLYNYGSPGSAYGFRPCVALKR